MKFHQCTKWIRTSLRQFFLLKVRDRDCFLTGIAFFCQFVGLGRPLDAMPPQCGMLESLKVKAKSEAKTEGKDEGAATPPAKKLATDMEKKLKNISGDTTLMKAGWVLLEKKNMFFILYTRVIRYISIPYTLHVESQCSTVYPQT